MATSRREINFAWSDRARFQIVSFHVEAFSTERV
jgi:hypothetical protein